MGGRSAFVLLSLLAIFPVLTPKSLGEEATVSIESVNTIGRTDDSFVCATLDWWPPEKCNYGMCPWGNSSILNLDLKNPILFSAIKAFKSLRIRLGGSLQDQVVYEVGTNHPNCTNFVTVKDGLFGFSQGCLCMQRWDEINEFFNETGVIQTFGLNALAGRRKATADGLYEGSWDPTNARDFIKYTVLKKYKIESWELGNELSGTGVSGRVDGRQYGKDLITLKGIINDLYNDTLSTPKLLAPGGFFDQKWFAVMLQTSGPDVVDGVTHHIYNLGSGVDKNLIYRIQDPYFLDEIAQTYRDVAITVKSYAPWSAPWVGEAGGAYNSGGKMQSSFVDSFWYLDQLGMVSVFGHKVFCRQSLIGGNYALLNTTTFIPNPDYYSALLWHRLMGSGVLQTTHKGSPYLRAYAHCSKNEPGITLLLINLSNSTAFDISVENDLNLHPSRSLFALEEQGQREEYHLTPEGGNIESNVMLLNGQPLNLTCDGQIPEMYPFIADASAPLHMAPLSIAFVRFQNFRAPACV